MKHKSKWAVWQVRSQQAPLTSVRSTLSLLSGQPWFPPGPHLAISCDHAPSCLHQLCPAMPGHLQVSGHAPPSHACPLERDTSDLCCHIMASTDGTARGAQVLTRQAENQPPPKVLVGTQTWEEGEAPGLHSVSCLSHSPSHLESPGHGVQVLHGAQGNARPEKGMRSVLSLYPPAPPP